MNRTRGVVDKHLLFRFTKISITFFDLSLTGYSAVLKSAVKYMRICISAFGNGVKFKLLIYILLKIHKKS